MNPVLDFTQRQGLAVTRGVYLAICYPDGMPDPWTAEDVIELPDELLLLGHGVPCGAPLGLHVFSLRRVRNPHRGRAGR